MDNKITCFLFGEKACEMWAEYIGVGTGFIPLLDKKQIDYDIFYYIEGITDPEELLLAFDGWRDWTTLSEKVYVNHYNSIT